MTQDSIYKEIGKNYRYFLSLRHAIYGAHLFILWGVFSICNKLYTNDVNQKIIGVLFIGASVLVYCLWIADKRNRTLYRALTEKGKMVEKDVAFTTLENESPKVKKRYIYYLHSTSQDLLAWLSLNVLIICGIVLLNEPNLSCFSFNQVSTFSKWFMGIIALLSFTHLNPFAVQYFFKRFRCRA